MSEALLFYSFSGLGIAGALGVIFMAHPAKALLSLMVTMFSLSVLYLLLGAPFVAMINLIVYAGAVLVLFLFVIMLQGIGARDLPLRKRFVVGYPSLAALAASGFFLALFISLKRTAIPAARGIQASAETVGRILFTHYLLPFELIAILLILAVFAAVSLAKKGPDE